MDNLARLYKARCEEAEKLACDGHRKEALNICWELRLCSDLSLYRRACVNYLIASIVPVETHPDCDKFAQECIDLVAQIRRSHPEAKGSEVELTSLEAHARTTLDQIRGMQAQLARINADAAKADDTIKYEKVTMSDEVKKALGISTEGLDDAEEKIDNPGKPWTIEGMYSDHMKVDAGAESESRTPKAKILGEAGDRASRASPVATPAFSDNLPVRGRSGSGWQSESPH